MTKGQAGTGVVSFGGVIVFKITPSGFSEWQLTGTKLVPVIAACHIRYVGKLPYAIKVRFSRWQSGDVILPSGLKGKHTEQ